MQSIEAGAKDEKVENVDGVDLKAAKAGLSEVVDQLESDIIKSFAALEEWTNSGARGE